MTSLFQKRIFPQSFFSIIIVLFYFSSCTEYKETPSAYQYEVHFDAEGETPKVGDKVIFHEKTFLNGKEIFSTYAFEKKEIILPAKENLTKPLPPNYEALFTMSPGDSLTVWQPLAGMENLPEGYQEKDMVSYVLKLVSVIPSTQLLVEKKKVGETSSGYWYQFLINTPNPKAQIGDRVKYLEWRFKNDSLIYRTQPGNWTEAFLPPRENLPAQPPGNYEALTLMGEGDSMKLSQPMIGVEELPDYLTVDDTLNYVIKMLEVTTPGEILIAKKLEQVQKKYATADAKEREAAVVKMTKSNIEKYNRGGFGKELIQRQSGLKYIIHKSGNGKRPVMRQEVTVHYAGFLMDGTNFDNSFKSGEPIAFPLGMKKVIEGWEEGIGMLEEGSQATLFVPYILAYGEAGSPPKIPEKADLAFYVEVIKIK